MSLEQVGNFLSADRQLLWVQILKELIVIVQSAEPLHLGVYLPEQFLYVNLVNLVLALKLKLILEADHFFENFAKLEPRGLLHTKGKAQIIADVRVVHLAVDVLGEFLVARLDQI